MGNDAPFLWVLLVILILFVVIGLLPPIIEELIDKFNNTKNE